MKAIILAGGSGSRLYPMTAIVSKQLQPIYDKPMIYYPISLLMLAGIRDILIISTERDTPLIEKLLGTGNELGMQFQYAIQTAPRGLSEAFIIGEEFIGDDDVALVLGDNLFYGDIDFFKNAVTDQVDKQDGIQARVFGYQVDDPGRYGVVEFDKDSKKVISIEEKPKRPRSNYAIPGLYVFDSTAPRRAGEQKTFPRGELEITDLMKSYLNEDKLGVQMIGRGVTWFDTGTPEALLEASTMIASIEKRQGLKVGCIHEIAYRKGFLERDQFSKLIESLPSSPYRQYLANILIDEE